MQRLLSYNCVGMVERLLSQNYSGMVAQRTQTLQVKHICSGSYRTTGQEWSSGSYRTTCCKLLLREHRHFRLNTYVAAPIVQLGRNGRQWLLSFNCSGMVAQRTQPLQVKHTCSGSYRTTWQELSSGSYRRTAREWSLREHRHYRLNTYVAAPIVQLGRNCRAAPIAQLLGNGRLENTAITG